MVESKNVSHVPDLEITLPDNTCRRLQDNQEKADSFNRFFVEMTKLERVPPSKKPFHLSTLMMPKRIIFLQLLRRYLLKQHLSRWEKPVGLMIYLWSCFAGVLPESLTACPLFSTEAFVNAKFLLPGKLP